MRILGFDPGETTGWCLVDERGIIAGGSFTLSTGVAKCLEFPDLTSVVVEKFMLYPWSAKRLKWNTLKAVEVIGVIKHLAEQANIPVIMQSASTGKSVELAEKYKDFDKHAHDALRHVLAFCKREGLLTDDLRRLIKC